ncbi:transmembrane domain-containing protein [Cryptosporidium canis]|uniref:Transmembrane domain-containing protein n=1 Tax=Cryptosporidium canis TaxID=195482 RepID=A0A9D5DLT6_9CRYT|nr:transmembrane domain-containing protein [Cryptosporidium canis]
MIPTIYSNKPLARIVIVGLLPCLNALFWLSFVSNGWIAMYSMHFICMLIFPIFVYGIRYISNNIRDTVEYMKSFDLAMCIYVALFTSAIGTLSLLLLLEISKANPTLNLIKIEDIKEGLYKQGIIKDPTHGLGLFALFSGIYFSLVNPVIEELFWRSFLYKELFTSLGYRGETHLEHGCVLNEIGDNYMDFLLIREQSIHIFDKYSDVESGQKNIVGIGLIDITCSVLYSLYHFFVLIHFFSLSFSTLSTISLAIAGWVLLYISKRFHIMYSIYIHIGMDLSIILFSLLTMI